MGLSTERQRTRFSRRGLAREDRRSVGLPDQPEARTGRRILPRSRRDGMAYKQSDAPPVLAPGCEELKCDVVGISKRQCGVVRRVHDATVGDAEFVQTNFPFL